MPDLFRHPPGGCGQAAEWIPACAGMTDRGGRIAGARFPCLEQEGVTGAVPLPYLPAAGTLHVDRGWVLTQSRDACLQPSYAQASSQGGCGFGRVTVKLLEVSSSHRPHSHGTRRPPGSGGIWPEVTPKGLKPPRRPHSSPTRRRTSPRGRGRTPRSVLFGRSYHLMHAEELRAGHVP